MGLFSFRPIHEILYCKEEGVGWTIASFPSLDGLGSDTDSGIQAPEFVRLGQQT